MIYVFYNTINILYVWLLSRIQRDKFAFFFLSIFLIIGIALLPGLQFEVGSDYNSYVDIYNISSAQELYKKKNEFAFYYLVKCLNSLGLNYQSLFLTVSFICSALIVNSLRLIRKNKFDIFVFFICFVLMTNMLHNQMNLLRTYVAVYFFINSFLYKINRKYLIAILCGLMGTLWHQSFFPMMIFLLIPEKIYLLAYSNRVKVYFFSSVFFILGIPFFALDFLVSHFAPFYSHYLKNDLMSSSFINVATKLYFIPAHLIFLHQLSLKKFVINDNCQKIFVAFWVMTANFYLLFFYWGHFFRVYHYFVFFSIVPVYYLMVWTKRSPALFGILVLYLSFPYFLKVLFFPTGEYLYRDVIFSESLNSTWMYQVFEIVKYL